MVEGEGLFPGTFVGDVVPSEGPVENLPLGKDSALVRDLVSTGTCGAPAGEGKALLVFSLGGEGEADFFTSVFSHYSIDLVLMF